MREAYAGSGAGTNSGPHNRAVHLRTNVRAETLTDALMRVAHDVFGTTGITKVLAKKTGRSTRTVEYWLAVDPAQRREMDLEACERLVAVDPAFLDAFVGRLPATIRETWLREKILEARLAKAEVRAANQKSEIEQLKLELRNER